MKKNMSKSFEIGKGDVLLLDNGRLVRVVSDLKKSFDYGADSYFMLQFVDKTSETYQPNDSSLDVERNLGQSNEVLANFYAMHSLHLRLSDAKGLFSEA